MKKDKRTTSNPLPKPLTNEDINYPSWSSRWTEEKQKAEHVTVHFQMHYVESFGWVIATLHIRNPGRHHVGSSTRTARTYAVRVDNGQVCRIGLGPHVKETVTVYIRERRVKACQSIIDLYNSGEVDANKIRDRISTRRANTILRRGGGGEFFGL